MEISLFEGPGDRGERRRRRELQRDPEVTELITGPDKNRR